MTDRPVDAHTNTVADPPPGRGPAALAQQVPADAIVLHIGTHKTGTTSLQSALRVRQQELAGLGVTYPLGHRAQHAACMALVQREFGWAPARPVEQYQQAWAQFADQVSPLSGRLLISSEWLCQTSDEQAHRAVQSLGSDRVQVLVAFRSLGTVLPSSWQQYLKNGWTARYDEWLDYVLSDPPSPKANSSFWQRNDVPATLRRWSELIGADRVTAVAFDGADRTLVPDTLADLLGINRSVLTAPPDTTVRSNRSLSVPEAELLLQVNPVLRDLLTAAQYTALVRNGAAEQMVEGRDPDRDEPRLGIPAWAQARVAELARAHADALRSSGVHVVGDPSLLEQVPDPVETGQPRELAVAAAAQALLGALQAGLGTPAGRTHRSLSTLTSKELLGEVARRGRARLRGRDRS